MEIGAVKKVGAQLLLGAALLALAAPAHAIPAFARKYGLPCSACHEAWPMLNNFGQTFKDNGYQLGNDRDSPIYQQPGYWPIMFRGLYTSNNRRLENHTGSLQATAKHVLALSTVSEIS